ncbi:MAG: CD225/dispanin family protein [Prevotellaceae bacterium]|jgi:hypothetical protein|nr:CD225/dispanin family protein [Prevotellaceae bacterium]
MKVITVGRNPANNVVINDPLVSKNHCQIIQDDYGNFSLVDNNSTNGTFVNGQRRQGQMRLNPSDIVRIGNTTLPWMSYFAGNTSQGSSATVVGNRGNERSGGRSDSPSPQKMPPNYLWQAIVVTILCCWPFGIPAIVNASRVQKRFLEGDYAGAEKASSNAKTWSIVSLVSGLVVLIIYIIYYAIVGAALFMGGY